jgi:hypothetical protein
VSPIPTASPRIARATAIAHDEPLGAADSGATCPDAVGIGLDTVASAPSAAAAALGACQGARVPAAVTGRARQGEEGPRPRRHEARSRGGQAAASRREAGGPRRRAGRPAGLCASTLADALEGGKTCAACSAAD